VITIGIDVCEVPRMRTVLGRRPRLADRVFTEAERAYAARKRDPTERLAARFAAKEATMKALGVGIGTIGFAEIEVVRGPRGAPNIALTGKAAEWAKRRNVVEWKVSLTHSELVAVAVVVGILGDDA
jgi:holo-[acyl-carrier protein] synthase